MIGWLHKVKDWFLALFKQKRPIYQLVHLDDLPEEPLSSRQVYYIGVEDHKWCIVFLCPCGCKDTIYLNTLVNNKPRWSITEATEHDFSIRPSIHRQVGCRSHFFIRDNHAVFV